MIAATMLALTGCAAGTPEPSETPAESPNAAACDAFGALTIAIGNEIVNGAERDVTDEIPERFDEVALRGEGEVRDRIEDLIGDLPIPPHMIGFLDNRKVYSDSVESVLRACEVEGFEIQVATLVPANG